MTKEKWQEMNDGGKRIRVAELSGWKFHKVKGEFEFISIHPNGDVYNKPFGDIAHLPDYLHDLNAMHEAEKLVVTGELWFKYKDCLEECVGNGFVDEPTIRATAEQRAEAFVMTMEEK